jgi:hypothetical protein
MSEDTKSKWQKLGKGLAKAGLGTLGTIVGGPAGGVLGSVISDMLGSKDNDDAATAALAKADPATFAKIQEIQASIELARLETQRNEEDNLTSRHAADMMSDSRLSKAVRPSVLILFSTAYIILIYAVAFAIPLERIPLVIPLVSALGGIVLGVVGFYFGGRSIEKTTSIFKA